VSCKPGLLACLLFTAISCSRQPANPGLQRIAILRFENLGADPSLDWMGRAFSELISWELSGAPGIYAVPFDRIHRPGQGLGGRPLDAPGISAERALALTAGANRLGYGDYSMRDGRLEAHLTIEDPATGKMVQVLSARTRGDSRVVAAATDLARHITTQLAPPPTQDTAALHDYVSALESSDAAQSAQSLEQAIAADPNFGRAYSRLVQIKLQQGDRAATQSLLDRALARGPAISKVERARLAYERASLNGDSHQIEQSLAAWARLAPNDPNLWSAAAQAAMAHHDYTQAVQAYQKALAIEPEDINLLNQLGYAAAYAGDLNTATQALQRYQTIRPGDANPLDSLGDVHLLLGRLSDAETYYLQAVKKDPAFLNGADYFKAAIAHLMTGDIPGAGLLEQQFLDARAKAGDPLIELQKAHWAWLSGHRKEALSLMAAFAQKAESGALRQVASEAYSQLAIWQVALGNRSAAELFVAQAIQTAGPGSAGVAVVARFIAQPSASAAEWNARADQAFPLPAQKPVKDVALVYALLSDKQFAPAAAILQPLYDRTSPTADDSVPFLLAWADLETDKPKQAAALLRFNPIPPSTGVKPFSVFYFPRLFDLRGRIAELAGDTKQANAQYALFHRLSGDELTPSARR